MTVTVRQYRRLADLTQAEVGKAVCKTAAWVCLVEKGKHIPSDEDARKLASFLNAPISDIRSRSRR